MSTDEKDQSIYNQLTFSGLSKCKAFTPMTIKPNMCTECMKLMTNHSKEAVEIKYVLDAIEYDQKNLNIPSIVLPRDENKKVGALLLGGYLCVVSLKEKSKQATHVVNTALGLEIFGPKYVKAVTSLKESGIKFINLDWVDNEGQLIDKDLQTAIEFIDVARSQGGDVLVHCAQGKSRSSTVVVAYLMAKSMYPDVETALKYTQEKRKMAEPNPGFMTKLKSWQESSTFQSLKVSLSSNSGISVIKRSET